MLGSPKTGTAYIVPMYQIMDNIAKRSDISLGVSTRTTPQPIQTICNVRSILVSRGIQISLSMIPSSGLCCCGMCALSSKSNHGDFDATGDFNAELSRIESGWRTSEDTKRDDMEQDPAGRFDQIRRGIKHQISEPAKKSISTNSYPLRKLLGHKLGSDERGRAEKGVGGTSTPRLVDSNEGDEYM